MIGLRISILPEIAHNKKRDMVAPRSPPVEVNSIEVWCSGNPDIALFGQLTRQGFQQRFACLYATSWQMPAIDVRVPDQKNTACAVNDHRAHAQRRAARKAPVKMQNLSNDWLEFPTQALQPQSPLPLPGVSNVFQQGGKLLKRGPSPRMLSIYVINRPAGDQEGGP